MEPGHLLHSALTCPSTAYARRLKLRHTSVSAAQHLISSSDNNTIHAYVRRTGLITNGMPSGRTTHKTPYFHSRHRAWVRLNRLRSGVGRFRSCLYKWDMASSAACDHRRTGRHFTGGRKKFALKLTICPKSRQLALKLTF